MSGGTSQPAENDTLSKLGITSGGTKTLSRKDRWSQALNPSAREPEANVLEPKARPKTTPWYSRLLGGIESLGEGLENTIAHGKGLKDLDYNDIKNFGAEAGRVFNKASQRAAEIATLSKPGELSTSINPVTLKEEKAQEPKTKVGNIFSELLGTLGYVAPTPGGLGTLMGRGEEAAAAIGKKVPQKLLSLIESKTPALAQRYGGKALKGAATGAGVFAQEEAFRPEGAKPGLKALPEEMAGFAGAEVGGEALDALIKRLLGKSAPEIREALAEIRPTITQSNKTIGRGALAEPEPLTKKFIPMPEGAIQKAPERTATQSMKPIKEPSSAPEATTELLAENAPIKPTAKEVLKGKIKGNVINVNDKQYELSGESLAKYKEAKAQHDMLAERVNALKDRPGRSSEYYDKQRTVKASAMQLAALKRDLTGEYTQTEITNLVRRERSNYMGKDVLAEVNGQNVPAKITGKPAFGSIEVELQGGERIRLKADKLSDPRTDEDILKQLKTKEEVKPFVPGSAKSVPAIEPQGEQLPATPEITPEKPTAKEEIPAWQMNASEYQSSIGVKQPWIAEISPYQFANLSKRAKAEYEANRRLEWQASADAKAEWRDKVMQAYDKGEITLDTPGLHDEVKRAIRSELQARDEAVIEAAIDKATKENDISSVDEVEPGDKVYDLMLGRYVDIVKKFKSSVRVKDAKGEEFTVKVRELRWKHYNDLEEAVKAGEPFKPERYQVAEAKSENVQAKPTAKEILKQKIEAEKSKNAVITTQAEQDLANRYKTLAKKALPKLEAKIKQIKGWQKDYLSNRTQDKLYKEIIEQGGIKFSPEVYASLDREEVNKIIPVGLRTSSKTGMSIDEMAQSLGYGRADELVGALRDIARKRAEPLDLPFQEELDRYEKSLHRIKDRAQGISRIPSSDPWEEDIIRPLSEEIAAHNPNVKLADIEAEGVPTISEVRQEIPETELRPIEVEGETKTRGLSKGVEEKAVENKLTKSLGELPEYNKVNMEEQAGYAIQILNEDPERAIRIAKNLEAAPSHVLPEAIFTAVENKALREGNIDLIKELAHSGLTEEATVMGQRIRALAERDPDSAVSNIRDVLDSRKKAVERRTGKSIDESFKEIAQEIKKEIKKPSKEDWNDFIDSLRC